MSRTPDDPGGRAAPESSGAAAAAAGAASLAEKYDQMLALADLFDRTGEEMRSRASLGAEVTRDDDVAASAELSPVSHRLVEEDVRAATTGKHGLLARGLELDADALMVRATVLTYQWIDELVEAAGRTMGAVASRAIGYLAPEVELGGAVVAAGLIETEPLDRDDVAGYLGELALHNPELLDHVHTGGGLLEGLQLRGLLTVSVLGGRTGPQAALGGLHAVGGEPMATDFGAALRDAAGSVVDPAEPVVVDAPATESTAPRSFEELMRLLSESPTSVHVQHLGGHRYIVYLPGPESVRRGRLRLVGGDHSAYAATVLRTVESAVDGDPDARVMLVGWAQGGVTAAEIAATVTSPAFAIDQVVIAGAPASQLPRIPTATRVLSLEDRDDPVAVLGSLINASVAHRTTVVFDASVTSGENRYVAGGRAVDAARHPELEAELGRLQAQGFLAS